MKALIVAGEGLNCEYESKRALERFGFTCEILRVKELAQNPGKLLENDLLFVPGGFSYGDEWGSGKILSFVLFSEMANVWKEFIAQKKLALGVCNGFQVLVKAGLFETGPRQLSITYNKPHGFINKWVECEVISNKSPWTKKLLGMKGHWPIRHGEGRIVREKDNWNGAFPVIGYSQDVNGSFEQVAGLCDSTGQVLGLMPHPEAALDQRLIPHGLESHFSEQLFQGAAEYLKENLNVTR